MYKKFKQRKEFVAGTYGWFKFKDNVAQSIVRKDFLQYWAIVGLGVLLFGLFINKDLSENIFLTIWIIIAGLGVGVILWYSHWFSFLIISSTGILGPSAGSYRRSRILWNRLNSINIRGDQHTCLFDSCVEENSDRTLSFDNINRLQDWIGLGDMSELYEEQDFLDIFFDGNFLVLSSTSFEEISIFLPFDCEEKKLLIEKILRGLIWYRMEYVR